MDAGDIVANVGEGIISDDGGMLMLLILLICDDIDDESIGEEDVEEKLVLG